VKIGTWQNISNTINPHDVYISKIDLEHDIADELPEQIKLYFGKDNLPDAIKYLSVKKAIRMR